MSKAHQLQSTLDNFVEKLSGVNRPYKALQSHDEYKKFHSLFRNAIISQVKEVAGKIDDILYLAHPLTPLNDSQKTDVENRVKAALPSLSSKISAETVYNYYKFCFEWGAKAQYQRLLARKVNAVDNFTLTNAKYIANLKDRANYLLNQSSLDDTTVSNVVDMIAAGKANDLTNDEVAQMLSDSFDDISDSRADMITRTETANAMGDGNYATMVENNVAQVEWVAAGDNPCPICEENQDASPIDVGDTFPSGDTNEPAHPNCECYTQAVDNPFDFSDVSIWDGN